LVTSVVSSVVSGPADGSVAGEGVGVVAGEGVGVVAGDGVEVVSGDGVGVVADDGVGVVADEGVGVVDAPVGAWGGVVVGAVVGEDEGELGFWVGFENDTPVTTDCPGEALENISVRVIMIFPLERRRETGKTTGKPLVLKTQ
jgi:hypothetical protein